VEDAPLLHQRDLTARLARSGDEAQRADLPTQPAAREQGHRAAFRVAHHGNTIAIDVLALADPLDHATEVVGIRFDGGALDASAALAHAAFVVAHNEEPGIGQAAGHLAEHWN